MTSREMPSASNAWAPQYDDTVEMPIFEMDLSSPLQYAAMRFRSASSASGTAGTSPRRCSSRTLSRAR